MKDPATALGEWYVFNIFNAFASADFHSISATRYGYSAPINVAYSPLANNKYAFLAIVERDETNIQNQPFHNTPFQALSRDWYSVYRKPKNGLGIMMVTRAAGWFGGSAFGWNKLAYPKSKPGNDTSNSPNLEKEAERRKS
jgi:hypothetical protein